MKTPNQIESINDSFRNASADLIAGFAMPGFQESSRANILRLFDEIDAYYDRLEFKDHGANI